MKAIFVLFMIVAIIGMAMAGHHHYKVKQAPPQQDDSGTFFDGLAHGADRIASGIGNFFG